MSDNAVSDEQEARRDDRPALFVSACLLGVACNHEGRGSWRSVVSELGERYRLIPVCPEVLGGLTTPRPAAEISGGDGEDVLAGRAQVTNVNGDDVTGAYRRGATAAVDVARAAGATRAVLKARSPSCGSSQIYDGTFSRRLVEGKGVTAAALRAAGIEVCSDEDAASVAGAAGTGRPPPAPAGRGAAPQQPQERTEFP